MQGEITYFRKKVFGGFNRDDVVAYIAALAKERDDAVRDAQTAWKEIERLREIVGGYEKLIVKLKNKSAQNIPASAPSKTNETDMVKPVIIIKKAKARKRKVEQ